MMHFLYDWLGIFIPAGFGIAAVAMWFAARLFLQQYALLLVPVSYLLLGVTIWSAATLTEYTACKQRMAAATIKEMQRQAEANRAARDETQTRILAMIAQNKARNILLEMNVDEAAVDPDLDDNCLPRSSVRRLNRIR